MGKQPTPSASLRLGRPESASHNSSDLSLAAEILA